MQQIENKHQIKRADVCCQGIEFTAFIIPDWAKSIKRLNMTQEEIAKDIQNEINRKALFNL